MAVESQRRPGVNDWCCGQAKAGDLVMTEISPGRFEFVLTSSAHPLKEVLEIIGPDGRIIRTFQRRVAAVLSPR